MFRAYCQAEREKLVGSGRVVCVDILRSLRDMARGSAHELVKRFNSPKSRRLIEIN